MTSPRKRKLETPESFEDPFNSTPNTLMESIERGDMSPRMSISSLPNTDEPKSRFSLALSSPSSFSSLISSPAASPSKRVERNSPSSALLDDPRFPDHTARMKEKSHSIDADSAKHPSTTQPDQDTIKSHVRVGPNDARSNASASTNDVVSSGAFLQEALEKGRSLFEFKPPPKRIIKPRNAKLPSVNRANGSWTKTKKETPVLREGIAEDCSEDPRGDSLSQHKIEEQPQPGKTQSRINPTGYDPWETTHRDPTYAAYEYSSYPAIGLRRFTGLDLLLQAIAIKEGERRLNDNVPDYSVDEKGLDLIIQAIREVEEGSLKEAIEKIKMNDSIDSKDTNTERIGLGSARF